MLFTYLLMFCRLTIGLVFALSFLGKVRNMAAFQDSVIDFQLLSVRRSKVVAWLFLGAEFVCSLCLFIGGALLAPGFYVSIALLLVFSLALVAVLRRRKKVRCNCFGWSEQHISYYDVLRNLVFLLCSTLGVWTFSLSQKTLSWDALVLISCMSLCFFILVTNIGFVIMTLRKPFHAFGVS